MRWARHGRDAISYAVAVLSLILAGAIVRSRPGRPAVRPVARSAIITGTEESRVVAGQDTPVTNCFDPEVLRAISRMGARSVKAR
jgi:hypothetical protein